MSRRENEPLIRYSKKLLPKLLWYGTAGPTERGQIRNKYWFRKALEGKTCQLRDEYSEDYKEYGLESKFDRFDAYKALIQTERDAINDSTLVQEEIMGTIFEGAEPAKCWRDIIPISTAESYQTRIIKGESGYYADEVSEGGAIPIDTENYTAITVPIKKYGKRPVITNELIDDCQFDIVERELRKAGMAMENQLNRIVLNEILDNVSTNTLNPAGTHFAVSDIALARSKILKANWPGVDTLVTHPTAEGYLLQDSNLAYASYAGTTSPLYTGQLIKLMGCTPYTCTVTEQASSPVWDDTTAGSDVTALVLSSQDLGVIRMKQDLKVENYDDPIHDIVGISLLMRYGAKVVNETAACKIYHK